LRDSVPEPVLILTQQQRMAGLSPDLAQRMVAVAEAIAQHRIDDAERGAIAAYAMAPNHPEVLHQFGRVHCLKSRFEPGLEMLVRAAKLRPNDALIFSDMGNAYELLMDNLHARKAFERACQVGAEYPSCWYNLARRMMADGDVQPAIEAARRALALAPSHVAARSMLAAALSADGRVAEAAAEFRRIIADGGDGVGSAWQGLSILKPMPFDDGDIATMERTLASNLSDNDRISIGAALALAYEHKKEYSRALEQFNTVHALARRREQYDADGFSKSVDSVLSAFASARPESPVKQGKEVIFIVSLPRSGSTLTEQILASHSQVEGAIELPDMGQVMMEESDRLQSSFFDWAPTRTPEQWQRLGRQYLERTARWRTRKPRSTDKAIGNWRYVGAILAMLPEAKIVIARRDKLETCFGCYRYLITRHPYVHDFDDLAQHYRDFDRAIAHWKAIYPGRVHEQIYEDLVADPEKQIRALLDYCDLPFEAACLNFHETERRVSTPSASQVREKIRTDTARTDKYGALLDPLRIALGMSRFVA
jgi:tetratricopeptide (TPR) repeat protein